MPKRSSVSRTLARSPTLACTKGPHLTASAWPRLRSSRTTGSCPARAIALAVWLPMYPAPPVTRMRMSPARLRARAAAPDDPLRSLDDRGHRPRLRAGGLRVPRALDEVRLELGGEILRVAVPEQAAVLVKNLARRARLRGQDGRAAGEQLDGDRRPGLFPAARHDDERRAPCG